MSTPNKEHLSDKAKENIAKEAKQVIEPVIRKLSEKLNGYGFDKKDYNPAIQKGLEEVKKSLD